MMFHVWAGPFALNLPNYKMNAFPQILFPNCLTGYFSPKPFACRDCLEQAADQPIVTKKHITKLVSEAMAAFISPMSAPLPSLPGHIFCAAKTSFPSVTSSAGEPMQCDKKKSNGRPGKARNVDFEIRFF